MLSRVLPVYNASGCRCTTIEQLDVLNDCPYTVAVLTKTSTMHNQSGNLKPRIYVTDNFILNSLGLPNYGYIYYLDYFLANKGKLIKPFIQSVYCSDVGCLGVMLDTLTNKISPEDNYMLEINLSCPNIENGIPLCHDFEKFESYLQCIDSKVKHIKWGIKLAPYFSRDEFDKVANLLKKYRVTTITCINSLGGCLLFDKNGNPKLSTTYGGLSGKPLLTIGLANVYQFRLRLKDIHIIGCGGVSTHHDILQYKFAGANAVQVGTKLWQEGIEIFQKLHLQTSKL